jgi:hypothetical protein
MTIKLIAADGALYTPIEAVNDENVRRIYSSNPVLLYFHPSGEVDTIRWPKFDEERLRSALYDARETGTIPNCSEVILPNGETFKID